MRNVGCAALLLTVGAILTPSATAQQNSAGQAASPAKTTPAEPQGTDEKQAEDEAIRRLPTFYREVVAPYQRKRIYDIQDRYEAQVKELQEQIKALLAKRDAEIDEVLNPEQRELLKQLKAAATQRAKQTGSKKSGTAGETQAPSDASSGANATAKSKSAGTE